MGRYDCEHAERIGDDAPRFALLLARPDHLSFRCSTLPGRVWIASSAWLEQSATPLSSTVAARPHFEHFG
jgi:hypothetical protein